jgi:hypothetical protein
MDYTKIQGRLTRTSHSNASAVYPPTPFGLASSPPLTFIDHQTAHQPVAGPSSLRSFGTSVANTAPSVAYYPTAPQHLHVYNPYGLPYNSVYNVPHEHRNYSTNPPRHPNHT